jgi:hypothetical protein
MSIFSLAFLLLVYGATLTTVVIAMTGCASDVAQVAPAKTYCIGGYKHSYSYNGGYRQVYNPIGEGVPC